MDDYALVLNAGSSSLKFCVYRQPRDEAWRLETRGQIEGDVPTALGALAAILGEGRPEPDPRR